MKNMNEITKNVMDHEPSSKASLLESYRSNRLRNPHVEVDSWKIFFGEETEELEKRFQAEIRHHKVHGGRPSIHGSSEKPPTG